jgi:hypothetical protein
LQKEQSKLDEKRFQLIKGKLGAGNFGDVKLGYLIVGPIEHVTTVPTSLLTAAKVCYISGALGCDARTQIRGKLAHGDAHNNVSRND